MNKLKHLYIHIPFCKHICTYCDFKRFISNETQMTRYIKHITKELERKYKRQKFETIYIGGGTPNFLSQANLESLLQITSRHLLSKYEFTIECNPEFVTQAQAQLFHKYKINRVSLGVQSLNTKILNKFQRNHTNQNVINALKYLRSVKINNISVDLIYGFNELTNTDLKQNVAFLIKNHIPHVSFYSLEVKPGSIIYQQKYHTNDEHIEDQFKFIIDQMQHNKFNRYEISSWCINKKYESIHNKAYWLTNDWGAIGLGAFGLENKTYYEYTGTLDKWKIKKRKYSNQEYYFQILMMGLRLTSGINLSIAKYKYAYSFFKSKLKYVEIKNNYLIASNINLLDNVLEEII